MEYQPDLAILVLHYMQKKFLRIYKKVSIKVFDKNIFVHLQGLAKIFGVGLFPNYGIPKICCKHTSSIIKATAAECTHTHIHKWNIVQMYSYIALMLAPSYYT